jgi:hypothetical protein
VIVPALERFLKDARPWGLEERHPAGNLAGKTHDRQRTDPDPLRLAEQIGLKAGSHVLFVAGHRGTWALALAKSGMKLTYSDASEELTEFAQVSVTHPNIIGYRQASYLLVPNVLEQYDWTVTFEAVGPRAFILFRSLLNRRGGKFIIWGKGDNAERKIQGLNNILTVCEDKYGATTNVAKQQINALDRQGRTTPVEHYIFTAETTPTARSTMARDLRLFEFLYKRKKVVLADLGMITGWTSDEIKGSLDRLSRWCDLFKEKYTRDVALR